MSTKKRIILHGYLADLYPHEIEVEASTVAEAILSLQNLPELKRADGSFHSVRIDDVDTLVALRSPTSMAEIHVRPVLGGAGGRGGFMQIIIGVALVALAFINPVAFLSWAGITQGSLFIAGGMMIAGGILQMLMPVPDAGTTNESSKYLGANKNTVTIGTRIPLGYGIRKLTGHYLSFDVDSDKTFLANPDPDAATVPTDVTYYTGFEDIFPDNSTPIDVADPLDGAVYNEFDKTTVAVAPLLGIYSSQTPSPLNQPTSGWIS